MFSGFIKHIFPMTVWIFFFLSNHSTYHNLIMWSWLWSVERYTLCNLSHHFERFTVATMTWLTTCTMEYLSQVTYVPLVVSISRSFPYSWLITGFVTGATLQVALVEQELLTLPEHLSSLSVFSVVCVACSIIFE